MDSHTLVWALELGRQTPRVCLTIVECPMRGRITTDEDVWLCHKWKPDVDVDSLVQAILPPGPVEDEVDTYKALAPASRVSELSKGMPCTQCAHSAKFWMSANTRTLVLAPLHKFLVPY